MNRSLTLLASLTLALSAPPAWSQNDAEDSAKLRDRIRILKTALNAREKPSEPSVSTAQQGLGKEPSGGSGAGNAIGHRTIKVTESNESQEPRLVTRLYDVSDLFAPAPSYAARYLRDLGNRREALFDSSETPLADVDRPAGAGGAGGGAAGTPGMPGGAPGGMGGAGMGGGMFDLMEDPLGANSSREIFRQFGGGMGAAYGPTEAIYSATQTSMDAVIEVITGTIDPDTWDENGGASTIQPLGLSLIVSTEPQIHRQIEDLISYFRKRWGSLRTISLRATWLWLDDSELATLVPDEEGPPRYVEGLKVLGLVDADAWKRHMRELGQANSNRAPGYRASLNCYNGQTVTTQTGRQALTFAGWQAVAGAPVDKETAAPGLGFAPRVEVVQEGASLQVTPATNTSGRFVVLDIHSRVTLRPEGAASGASVSAIDPSDPEASAPEVSMAKLNRMGDHPMFVTQRVSTTMRLPVDRQVLIGGMSFDVAPKPGSKSLYLFVKVGVQELRDDVAPKAAGATGPDYVPPTSTPDEEIWSRP